MSEDQSILTNKSHELITENLVKQTLKNDKGENVEFVSFEIKDFTNKGDGYMSVVTSITVKYKDNGYLQEKSYVAKLNPMSPQSSFTDFTEEVFSREITVLSSIIEDMNKELQLLGLTRIKTPKLYSFSLEKGREAFVTENLRTQGFKLHDKEKSQDLKHALLVVEELGRFHASSLLLEDTIAPKTFSENYENFEETWMDVDKPSFKIVEAMFKAQVDSAINILSSLSEYERCVQWLKDHGSSFPKYYIYGFTPCKPFDVLVHGDSWTNNMLFKYDAENNPVDMRFVDLQLTRKGSPACDIIYFLYSSLAGDVRSKYFKDLLVAYYQSFCRVLNLANKTVPFTYNELEKEVEKRKLFGYIMGILVVQTVLFAEGDDVLNFREIQDDKIDEFAENTSKVLGKVAGKGGPFKHRFLSIFDDILESSFLEETVPEIFTGKSTIDSPSKMKPHEAITQD